MADFQRVVEFLRDVRQGPMQTVTDEIAQLATDYAALCVQANERLRQCSTFLQQGLRSEALHLADDPPNLLDLVAALDLPDQQAWMEFCQNNGLAVPPPLQLDRASQLNDAYAQDQPMEHLLAQHRLLALSRAPVRQRLDIMRKLVQADAGNVNWEKDVRIFEKARMKEIPSAFHQAVKNRDNDAIGGLMEEVVRQPWFEPVPVDLVSAVSDAYSRVQRQGVEADLRKLVEPLRDAYAARSLQECQALVQRWKNTMSTAGVTQVSAELTDEIRPVVIFVNDQIKREDYLKRFRESCKAFTALLDEDAGDAQLEAGYARLKEFKEEIPEEITRRYTSKRTGRRRDVERGHKVRLMTIGGVTGGAIIVALVIIWLLFRSKGASEAAQKIDAFVNQHTVAAMTDAQNYVDSLAKTNAALLSESNVSAAVGRLKRLEDEAKNDREQVVKITGDAATALAQADGVITNGGASVADVSKALDALTAVQNSANGAAKELAWVDETQQISAAMANFPKTMDDLRGRVSVVIRAELGKIGTELAQVPPMSTDPTAAAEIRNRVGTLRDRLTEVAKIPLEPALKTEVDKLAAEISSRQQSADTNSTVAEALQNVRSHTDSAFEVQTALSGFVRRFPDDPRKNDFTTALARLSLANGIDDWRTLVNSFDGNFNAGTAQASQKRIDAINAYLAANPGSPMTATANAYADYLKHAVDAQGEQGPWQTDFLDLVSNPFIADMGYMEASDGRKFTVLLSGDIKYLEKTLNGQVSVEFTSMTLAPDVKNPDPKKRELMVQTPRIIRLDPPDNVRSKKPTPYPHTLVVSDLVQSLKKINESNWDTFGIELAEKLARSVDMDVVVKGLLMEQALKTEVAVNSWNGAGPDTALEGIYARSLSELDRQKLAALNWSDPDSISDATRKSIKMVLDAVPSPTTARQKLAAAKAALFKSLALNIAGTGILLKDDGGAWAVCSHAVPVEGGTLVAIQPAADGTGPATLLTVGNFAGGKYVLIDSALRKLPEGTLIYILKP